MNNRTQVKIREALDLMADCFGERGVHASPDRYRGQCWTRDFALAIQPALLGVTEKHFPLTPYGSGWWIRRARELADRHLRELGTRMIPVRKDLPAPHDGFVPIVFLDGPGAHLRFLGDKLKRSFQQGRMSFMLKRYLQGKLWLLTPGTRDSELMFCHALLEHAELSGTPLDHELSAALEAALGTLQTRRMDSTCVSRAVLHIGGDWRDTMEAELADKALLSNNAILYAVFKRLGWHTQAQAVRDRIRARRDGDGLLLDYEGASWFDPLGGALAVLYDLATEDDWEGVLRGFEAVDSAHGVRIKCKHNAYGQTAEEVQAERAEIERTGGLVVWPFIGWFAAMAAWKIANGTACSDPLHGRAMSFAVGQEEKLLALDGFSEWYSPDTGRGWGAPRQLWSAALLLRDMYPKA